ncbi:DNA helicase IV [Martelella alba]|uniref:DNA 3'-5' helicase n=1 Tax=Martelella alba TaxID=2590451 RepID=A0ABY2SPJ6_9HYPH|nr:DNA helicase IV [Martelella alba]TKI07528.1 DNA helicase IV [Martelella alba]
MELKSTSLGKHLAQHPYNRVRLLNAGVEVSGEKHHYVIPFNEILAIRCKRGIVWGELEFELPDARVVRLHGTEWQETQRFYQYLQKIWRDWSHEMSLVCAEVLKAQTTAIAQTVESDQWLRSDSLASLQASIREAFGALPLPTTRLDEFETCREPFRLCRQWLQNGPALAEARNRRWADDVMTAHGDFFANVESSPLNTSQMQAVVNGEQKILVLAGAGSGKTSVLVARVGWLLRRQEALSEQILMLAFGREAAAEMDARIRDRLGAHGVASWTFHALALHIIRQGSKKAPVITKLENDGAARRALLIKQWRLQCADKKAQAKGWRQWLTDALAWELPEGDFWQNDALAQRLAPRLDRWIGLMRMHGGSQTQMIASAPEACRAEFQKRLRLLTPLLKIWKQAMKEEGAVDFAGLIHQAVDVLQKGRFISPWKHILVDEYQDISPQRVRLLEALCQQNHRTSLFAVGDDWQAIYRFSGAELSLTTAFHERFADAAQCALDTTYRFNQRIGEIANAFVLQNPYQLHKPLNSLVKGEKKAVLILPQAQLEALLNKLSGYALPDERILILARYHYLRPALLDKAATRWPNLVIDFKTMHGSKGQQADYVIIIGMSAGKDGFPAPARETVIEQALLPQPEDFPDAEERRLMYVALTRARRQVWLLQDPERPSPFIGVLRQLGVSHARKP